MLSTKVTEDPRAVKEIVHQDIDRDHDRAGFDPRCPLRVAAQQQLRHRDCQHLVGHAIDMPKRLQQCRRGRVGRSLAATKETVASRPSIQLTMSPSARSRRKKKRLHAVWFSRP
jgi:hypothetical protein